MEISLAEYSSSSFTRAIVHTTLGHDSAKFWPLHNKITFPPVSNKKLSLHERCLQCLYFYQYFVQGNLDFFSCCCAPENSPSLCCYLIPKPFINFWYLLKQHCISRCQSLYDFLWLSFFSRHRTRLKRRHRPQQGLARGLLWDFKNFA